MSDTEPRAVILMGVAGSGKSTVGANLAERLAWTFLDADDFHPAANVQKMSNGIPLNDEDRMPWLRRLHDELEHRLGSGRSIVLGCSALRGCLKSPSRSRLTVQESGFVPAASRVEWRNIVGEI
jgi:gluconokinase